MQPENRSNNDNSSVPIDFKKLEELMPLPYCNRCKKSADHFTIIYSQFSFKLENDTNVATDRRTGEIIVKINCHGTEYKFSNIKGYLGE